LKKSSQLVAKSSEIFLILFTVAHLFSQIGFLSA